MFYIKTLKNTDIPELKEDDKLAILCKTSSVIKAEDLGNFLKYGPQIDIYLYEDKDDMLVCLGAILSNADSCTILDESLPIPKRFSDKVHSSVEKVKKTRKPRKRKSDTSIQYSDFVDNNDSDVLNNINLPESESNSLPQKKKRSSTISDVVDETESAVKKTSEKNVDKSDMIEDIVAQKLYTIIGLSSKDVGYSWGTEMMMLNIATKVEAADSDEELKNSILLMPGGSRIWKRMSVALQEIRQIVMNQS